MSDIEIIGDAVLYCGDCREVLPGLPKVDLVVTDPPYKLEAGGCVNLGMGGKFHESVYDNGGAIIPVDIEFGEWLPLLAERLDRGHAYIMVNNRYVAHCQHEAEAAGFRFHNVLVWDKGIATPNRWYMKNCEFTLFMFRGRAQRINDAGCKQLVKCPPPINAAHETQKPIALMEHYIGNSSSTQDLVLDPFMGSGTTGVAALRMGRRFIGVEKNREYFEIACDRMRQALPQRSTVIEHTSQGGGQQSSLFGEKP